MTQNNKCKIILNLAHRNGKILNDIDFEYIHVFTFYSILFYSTWGPYSAKEQFINIYSKSMGYITPRCLAPLVR